MKCHNCGHFNWPYVAVCKKCGKQIYAEFWKGKGLREFFTYCFLLFSFFSFIGLSRHLYSKFSLEPILIGIVIGIIFGYYFIIYLRARIQGNVYLLTQRTSYTPQLIIGILISLFFITFPLKTQVLNNDFILIPLFIAPWIGITITFIWLIRYEIKNGRVIMK